MNAPRTQGRRLIIMAAAALVLIAASTLLGPRWPPWPSCAEIKSIDFESSFWKFRVLRTIKAAFVGAGLAVGGVIFQALFRNPLAEPYTLGIASGASLGAALAFLIGISGKLVGVPVAAWLALAGACVAMGLVYLMARVRGGQDMTRLLLAGVCVSYMCSAGILLVTFLSDQTVTNAIVRWLMGSLDVYPKDALRNVGVVLAITFVFALLSHRGLDLLWLGDQLAAARGVAVDRTIWGGFVLVGLLTAVIVANCGPIGFVGLMVPHMTRALVGPRTLPLLVGSVFVGASFLAVCDALGRSLLSIVHRQSVGFEIPVGVLTSILGAGFFFYLLATRDTAFDRSR